MVQFLHIVDMKRKKKLYLISLSVLRVIIENILAQINLFTARVFYKSNKVAGQREQEKKVKDER